MPEIITWEEAVGRKKPRAPEIVSWEEATAPLVQPPPVQAPPVAPAAPQGQFIPAPGPTTQAGPQPVGPPWQPPIAPTSAPTAPAPALATERPGLAERAGEQFLNRLILQDVESAVKAPAVIASEIGRVVPHMEDAEFRATYELPEDQWPEKYQGFLGKMRWLMHNWTKGVPAAWEAGQRPWGFAAEPTEATVAARVGGPSPTFAVPPAETIGEKAVDVGAGLGAFLARLAVTRKLVPADLQGTTVGTMLAWEMENTQGIPGEGAVMGLVLHSLGRLQELTPSRLAKLGVTAGESAIFMGIAKSQGADLTDTIIAGLIPPALRGFRAARGAFTKRLLGAKTVKEALGIMREAHAMRRAALKALGLKPGASSEQIRQAYHDISKKYHPDVAGKRYEAVFKRAAAAVAYLRGGAVKFDPADIGEPPAPAARAPAPQPGAPAAPLAVRPP